MGVLWIFKKWYYWVLVAFTALLVFIQDVGEGYNPYVPFTYFSLGYFVGTFLWPFVIILIIYWISLLFKKKKNSNKS